MCVLGKGLAEPWSRKSFSMWIVWIWLSVALSMLDAKVYNFLLTQGVWNKKDFFKSMGMLRQWSGFGNDMIMEKMWTWLKKQMYPQLLAFLDFFFKNFQSQLSQAVCTHTWCNFLKVKFIFDGVFSLFKSKKHYKI